MALCLALAAAGHPDSARAAFPGCTASSLAEQNLSGCDLRTPLKSHAEALATHSFADLDFTSFAGTLRLEGRNLKGSNLSLLGNPAANVLSIFDGADLNGASLTGTLFGGSFARANFANTSGGQISILSDVSGANFAGSTIKFSESISGLPASLPTGVVALPVITEPPCVDREAPWNALWFKAQRSRNCSFQVYVTTAGKWLQAYWILNKGKSIHDAPQGWGSLMGALTFDPTQAMVGLDLARVDLRSTNLSGARLEGTNLSDSNLENADLSAVNTGGMVVPSEGGTASAAANPKRGAKLFRAKLTGVNINKAKLQFAGLAGVITGGLKGTPSTLPSGWLLASGYLIGPKANLTKARLRNVDFKTTNLAGTVLTGADLAGAKMKSASLTGVISSSLSGQPASLPTGWKISGGRLVRG